MGSVIFADTELFYLYFFWLHLCVSQEIIYVRHGFASGWRGCVQSVYQTSSELLRGKLEILQKNLTNFPSLFLVEAPDIAIPKLKFCSPVLVPSGLQLAIDESESWTPPKSCLPFPSAKLNSPIGTSALLSLLWGDLPTYHRETNLLGLSQNQDLAKDPAIDQDQASVLTQLTLNGPVPAQVMLWIRLPVD